MDGLSPRVVVLLIGVNHLWNLRQAPVRVAEGIAAVVADTRVRLPHTRVLVLGILPTSDPPDHPRRAAIRKISALTPTLDDGEQVRFLDRGPRFTEPDGSVAAVLMPVGCHLSTAGYARWSTGMAPLLHGLLSLPDHTARPDPL